MRKSVRISAFIMALLMLTGVVGCRKNTGQASGEWLSERDYYYYDAGSWVEITDDSFFDNLESEVAASNTDSNEDDSSKEQIVDSSSYQTLVDTCGNDDFKNVFDKKNIVKDSRSGHLLLDDFLYRKHLQEKGDAYVTYKVDGIAEFFVEYCYFGKQRNSNVISFHVSKDNVNWTEVKPQDEIYQKIDGQPWIVTKTYFGNIDTENKYLKIHINTVKKSEVYVPGIRLVQINGLTEEVLGGLGMYNSKLPAKTIYIDSKNGKDTNSGTSENEPLKTLYAASKKVYSPGSKILLKSGCEFSGSLTVIGNGTAKKPITITSYGKGNKPVINARGGSAIEAYGEYMTFTGLKITNKAGKAGITLMACKPGAVKGINVTKCDFQDININFKYTAFESSGVYLSAAGREPCWFEGVNISENTFKKVGRCGIVVASDWTGKVSNQEWGNKNNYKAGEWFGNKNVVVRNNKLEEICADGIILFGCEGGLVEKNVVSNSGLFKNMGEIHWVSIWGHSCTGTIFQYNEVYGNSSKNYGLDIQAFDSDIANENCVYQYNYSHDNDGGFMLICANDATHNAQNSGTIVRYNLSVNDGKDDGMIIDISSSVYDAQIYNNTIYNNKFKNLSIVNLVNYDGGPSNSKNTVLTNNIFYAGKGAELKFTFKDGKYESAIFNNNVYYAEQGASIALPAASKKVTVKNSITDKIQLIGAGTTGTGLEKIAEKYKPKSDILLTKGVAVKNSGGKDLLGKKVDNKLIGALDK